MPKELHISKNYREILGPLKVGSICTERMQRGPDIKYALVWNIKLTKSLKRIYNVIGMRKTRKAFTLVELIIVMSIIAIFGGMAIATSVMGNLQKGRDGRRQTDLEAIRSVLEIYRSDNSAYPLTATWKASLSPTYMTTVPTDPKTNGDYVYTSGGTTYQLCADLEKVAGVNDYCVTNP